MMSNEVSDQRGGCVDQTFTLKEIVEKVRKSEFYLGFMDLEKAYCRANREALWQVLRMYDVVVNF